MINKCMYYVYRYTVILDTKEVSRVQLGGSSQCINRVILYIKFSSGIELKYQENGFEILFV